MGGPTTQRVRPHHELYRRVLERYCITLHTLLLDCGRPHGLARLCMHSVSRTLSDVVARFQSNFVFSFVASAGISPEAMSAYGAIRDGAGAQSIATRHQSEMLTQHGPPMPWSKR